MDVIPCYRSENTITTVVEEIKSEMAAKRPGDDYEIVLVNDSSPDNVWKVIQGLAQKEKNVIGINLAKNFGQHSALLAGYGKCSGEYVVSLDDDGQAPLDSLNDLIAKLEEGYDVVYAYYHEIKQNLFRRFGSWMAGLTGKFMLDPPKDMKGSSFYVARRDSRNVQLQERLPVSAVPCATHHSQNRLGRNESSLAPARDIGLFVCSSAWALAEWFHGVLGKTFALEHIPWIFLRVPGFRFHDTCGCPQVARPHNGG